MRNDCVEHDAGRGERQSYTISPTVTTRRQSDSGQRVENGVPFVFAGEAMAPTRTRQFHQ